MPSHFIRYRNTTSLYLGVFGVEILVLIVNAALELSGPDGLMIPAVSNALGALMMGFFVIPHHPRCATCFGAGAASAIFLLGFIATLSNFLFLMKLGDDARVVFSVSLVAVALLLIPLQVVPLIALTERYSYRKGIRPAFALWPFFFALSYAAMTGYSWKFSSTQFWYLLGAQTILLTLCISDIGVLREKPLKKSSKKK